MPRAYLALVLHAHLPFVRHPERLSAQEENWLFEALSETYLPLIAALERLQQEGLSFRLTLSVSPTLAAMLQDAYLQQAYRTQLEGLCRLSRAQAQVAAQQGGSEQQITEFYSQWFAHTLRLYQRCQGDLLGALRRLQQAGVVELITTAATHAYLPLLRVQEGAVQAQIRLAGRCHERVFQQPAPGFWLPECAYYPGLEQHLKNAGVGYFFVDTHGLLNSRPVPHYGVYAPIRCANGVWAFARDPACSAQVWSAEWGYPGDPDYREFYQDRIRQVPEAQLQAAGLALPCVASGLKYYRITGNTPHKQLYQPAQAQRKARQHAEDFWQRRLDTAAQVRLPDRPPLFVACYDAELFGHWWFEGVAWLEHLIRHSATQGDLECISPSQYMQRHPHVQSLAPAASSWGEQGYHQFWLNQSNDWIYPQLRQGMQLLQDALAVHGANPDTQVQRTLKQAARSLLLAQASDWAFILKSGTTVAYAEQRVRDALARLHYLLSSLQQGRLDETHLRTLEYLDAIFPELDWRSFLA